MSMVMVTMDVAVLDRIMTIQNIILDALIQQNSNNKPAELKWLEESQYNHHIAEIGQIRIACEGASAVSIPFDMVLYMIERAKRLENSRASTVRRLVKAGVDYDTLPIDLKSQYSWNSIAEMASRPKFVWYYDAET